MMEKEGEHKAAYEEILRYLQDAELAARNKEYATAMTCAKRAADCADKWRGSLD